MIKSLRSALQNHGWLRAIILFSIFMAVGIRQEILHAMGYADAGRPRWIFAGALATAFILYILLSARTPLWLPVAARPRIVRFPYAALFLIACAVLFTSLYAHVSLTDPVILISAVVVMLMCLFEWLAGRKQARI